MDRFFELFGFKRSDVTLGNWRESPFSRYTFSNVSEIVPSAIVPASNKPAPIASSLDDTLLQQSLTVDGASQSLISFLEATKTDVFMHWRDGKIVSSYKTNTASLTKPHIVFSISKSVTGLLCGILEEKGLLDVEAKVSRYLPEACNSGFGDCPIRHVLDMRVGLDFEEEYLNEDGDYARYRRATNWNPQVPGTDSEPLEAFLYSLGKGNRTHGGSFRYLSPASDLLGILIERVAGRKYAELLSELLWEPVGASGPAHITVDTRGAPRAAGGISMTPEDLLRIGILLLNDGVANGKQIVPNSWIEDMLTNGNDEAWDKGEFDTFVPKGRYRSQWYQMPRGHNAFFAVGIHGQWLYVDRDIRTVIVKLSSQDIPQDDGNDQLHLTCFKQLANIQAV